MSWPRTDGGLASRLRGPLSHAYILSGGSEEDREAAALYLAARALCGSAGGEAPCGACANCRKLLAGIHPDLHIYARPKDKSQIQVDQVRELRASAYILPNEAEKSVFIVQDAHLMNPNAQNALLKVFEEPPRHALILLLTENAGALLPTLRSRAVTLRLLGTEAGAEEDGEAGALLELLAQGKGAEAAAFCLKLDKLERERFCALLQALRRETAAGLRAGTGLAPDRAGALLRLLDKLEQYMEFNVGAGHAAGALAAFAAQTA